MRIISGGQTGVDRGALEAALDLEIPHGGFCPRGRRAEDGRIPDLFQLTETTSDKYPPRTAANVNLADGTLMLVPGMDALASSKGTKLTLSLCRNKKPWWVADPRRDDHVPRVLEWIEQNGIEILNVAGPRESSFPGIQEQTRNFIRKIISRSVSCDGENHDAVKALQGAASIQIQNAPENTDE